MDIGESIRRWNERQFDAGPRDRCGFGNIVHLGDFRDHFWQHHAYSYKSGYNSTYSHACRSINCCRHNHAIRRHRNFYRRQLAKRHGIRAMDIVKSRGGRYQREWGFRARKGRGGWQYNNYRKLEWCFFKRGSYRYKRQRDFYRGHAYNSSSSLGHFATVHRDRIIFRRHDARYYWHGHVDVVAQQRGVDYV